MSVEQMRIKIATVYPGLKWKNKVTSMRDNQVIALYSKFLNNKKLK